MVVADGVNWGEKSKLAARCAVYGAVKHVNSKLFASGQNIKNTKVGFTFFFRLTCKGHTMVDKNENLQP